ncbi:hypothetical protein LOTGIDRAFT_155464 [Lottia gigantea]|uniref:ZP domain-containing protein n=1 Tax=Lottia gigantea TaxID=225164 RepID=V4B6H4_LOTGI|nr:hypothetical protein LOTGIDRAFT_155464 [Lottia gigantea]ESO84139.1 hypothetical protein LOTGIDRAFT_155464 [Lottia gigantea]
MLVSFLTLLLILSSGNGQTTKNCCLPDEYEMDMGETGSTFKDNVFQEMQGFLSTSYSHKDRKVSSRGTNVVNGQLVQTTVLMDYKTHREYINVNGNCTVYEMKAPMINPCIPDNALFGGRTRYGYGSNHIDVDLWRFNLSNRPDSPIKLSITDDCTPITQTQFDPKALLGGKTEVVYIFSNFRPGIKARNIFTVPTECHNKPVLKHHL